MAEPVTSKEVSRYEGCERDAYALFFDSIGALAMDFSLSYMQNGETIQFACAESPNATLLNRILGLGISRPVTGSEIDLAIRRARTLKVSCTTYVIEGYTHPINMAAMLEERGFVRKARSSVMVYDPEKAWETPPPVNPEITIQPVSSGLTDVFVDTVCEGFELHGGFRRVWEAITAASVGHPQQKCFLAYIDGRPAGGLTLAYSKDGNCAGIYSNSTMPEFRHHGVQNALLQTGLKELFKSGATLINAQTPYDGSSQRNLERNGFRVAYVRDHYLYKPQ